MHQPTVMMHQPTVMMHPGVPASMRNKNSNEVPSMTTMAFEVNSDLKINVNELGLLIEDKKSSMFLFHETNKYNSSLFQNKPQVSINGVYMKMIDYASHECKCYVNLVFCFSDISFYDKFVHQLLSNDYTYAPQVAVTHPQHPHQRMQPMPM